MPEFFIPDVDDPAMQEDVWNGIRTFLTEQHEWNVTPARIFRLDYIHNDKHEEAEVGKAHPYGFEYTWDKPSPPPHREPVVAIFQCDNGPYLVCTQNRGVIKGEPILVGTGETYQTTYFDGYKE